MVFLSPRSLPGPEFDHDGDSPPSGSASSSDADDPSHLPSLGSLLQTVDGVPRMAAELVMSAHHRRSSGAGLAEAAAVQEAAAAGLQSIQQLIALISRAQTQPQQTLEQPVPEADCSVVADAAVSRFRKVISLLNRTRTGHARFRRAPPPPPPPNPCPEPDDFMNRVSSSMPIQKRVPVLVPFTICPQESPATTISFGCSPELSAPTSFSSLSADAVNAKPPMISQIPPAAFSSGAVKRKCGWSEHGGSGKCSGSSDGCHCSRRKKTSAKRVVRVPAISMKMADIPPDDFSWRKYGQKPIKGSSYPRGYYKCSSVRGCPARKHVERAMDDPAMLIVAYEGEHNHQSLSMPETAGLILESS